MSTFPYLILKMRIIIKNKNDNENNINNSKEKRRLAVERGVKTEGMKTPVCVCVFVSPPQLTGSLLALAQKRRVTCLCSVGGRGGGVLCTAAAGWV